MLQRLDNNIYKNIFPTGALLYSPTPPTRGVLGLIILEKMYLQKVTDEEKDSRISIFKQKYN